METAGVASIGRRWKYLGWWVTILWAVTFLGARLVLDKDFRRHPG